MLNDVFRYQAKREPSSTPQVKEAFNSQHNPALQVSDQTYKPQTWLREMFLHVDVKQIPQSRIPMRFPPIANHSQTNAENGMTVGLLLFCTLAQHLPCLSIHITFTRPVTPLSTKEQHVADTLYTAVLAPRTIFRAMYFSFWIVTCTVQSKPSHFALFLLVCIFSVQG